MKSNTAMLMALLVTSGLTVAANPLSMSGGWVRAGPPSVSVYAGYLVLHNESDQSQTIVGASSPRFANVQIHRTEIENGVARMVEQAELVLDPHSAVSLEPGGLHLMLIEPSAVPALGELIPVRLALANGTTLQFELAVRADAPAD